MNKKGFTIIELLIVIAVIGVLLSVATPYYSDYIYDARIATLKQNLVTYRKVLNQFRGDNLRGPFKVKIKIGGRTYNDPFTIDNELVTGPVQTINGTITKRTNLNYLPNMPAFINPNTGAQININETNFITTGNTSYFYDTNNNNIFDIATEMAYIDNDPNDGENYINRVDSILFTVRPTGTTNRKQLDYTSFKLEIDGIKY